MCTRTRSAANTMMRAWRWDEFENVMWPALLCGRIGGMYLIRGNVRFRPHNVTATVLNERNPKLIGPKL